MGLIIDIKGREILDSRGTPTVEADVYLDTGLVGRASVPSGASTGSREAVEMRDRNKTTRFRGKGVQVAVENINGEIYECLVGLEASRQDMIDKSLIELDGTENKERLGANSILAVSLAVARASAKDQNCSLYRYLGGVGKKIMPTPMMNVINGGAHANNSLDIQEFMIVPYGFDSIKEAIRCGVEVFQALKGIMEDKKMPTTVGDEGGFAPNLDNNRQALDLILEAVNKAGFSCENQVGIALDCASTEFFNKGKYQLLSEGAVCNSPEFVNYLTTLVDQYPIISIEDGMAEGDEEGWKVLTESLGAKVQLVGDDLFVTNTKILSSGIKNGIANALLVKPNQIGTLTETLEAIDMAKRARYGTIVSHRSGETEDSFIADLSVATNALQIKTGSLSRSDRLAKYNQLIRIEEELGGDSSYGGKLAFETGGWL